jgi:hypothetical protein
VSVDVVTPPACGNAAGMAVTTKHLVDLLLPIAAAVIVIAFVMSL